MTQNPSWETRVADVPQQELGYLAFSEQMSTDCTPCYRECRSNKLISSETLDHHVRWRLSQRVNSTLPSTTMSDQPTTYQVGAKDPVRCVLASLSFINTHANTFKLQRHPCEAHCIHCDAWGCPNRILLWHSRSCMEWYVYFFLST